MLHAVIGRMLGFAIGTLAPKWLVWAFAKHFIAGPTKQEAFERVKLLNKRGFFASVDYSGEEVLDSSEILKAKLEYLALIEGIKERKLWADVSLKLSHFGLFKNHLPLREEYPIYLLGCEAVEAIARKAKESGPTSVGLTVWIDAERLDWRRGAWLYAMQTLKRYDNIGICIQAYAPDAVEFLEEQILRGWRGSVRVCKGAYRELKHEVLIGKALEENFIELCELVLKRDLWLQIATHDEKLIRRIGGYGPREHGMLLGVNPELAMQLATEGKNVKIYIPYGEDPKGYVARRLAERPEYILLPFRRHNRSR
ncbi:MAG: proline dehydrogenase family protein [Candidatus Sungiibacteriota bacterium]